MDDDRPTDAEIIETLSQATAYLQNEFEVEGKDEHWLAAKLRVLKTRLEK